MATKMNSSAIALDKFKDPVWRMLDEDNEASVSTRTNKVKPRIGIKGRSTASATMSRQSSGAAHKYECVIANPSATRAQSKHSTHRTVRRSNQLVENLRPAIAAGGCQL
jgi:hypothetical protein